jgi:hypothetical protein
LLQPLDVRTHALQGAHSGEENLAGRMVF